MVEWQYFSIFAYTGFSYCNIICDMEKTDIESNDDEYIYDAKVAARIILKGVSQGLRKKLRFDDVLKILDYKYEFLEMEGYLTEGIPTKEQIKELDVKALNEFVLANAHLRKILLTEDELEEIWEAELEYYDTYLDDADYIVEDAAETVYQNISDELKEKFTVEEIVEILEVEFEFQEKIGLISEKESIAQIPADVDSDAMEYYIIQECAKKEIILTYEELAQILDGEEIYLRSQDLIDDDGIQKLCN